MSTEQEPLGVYKAIVAITADLAKEGISKDRKNSQQGYSFRGIEDVYAALSPLLSKHGVCIIPCVKQRLETERAAKSGGAIYSVAVEVNFILVCAEDGSEAGVVVWGEAMDSADKATNKAMSAAYKYMAFLTFCIPVEGMDDADAVTPETTKPKLATKPVTSYDLIEEAISDIKQATTQRQLDGIAQRLRQSKFSETETKQARDAWVARQGFLGKPAE